MTLDYRYRAQMRLFAFFPGETIEEFTGASGVFDFDDVLSRTLWEEHSPGEFFVPSLIRL